MSNSGWVCPRCKKVHAPFVPSCNCKVNPNRTELDIDKMVFRGACNVCNQIFPECKCQICPDCGTKGPHYCTGKKDTDISPYNFQDMAREAFKDK